MSDTLAGTTAMPGRAGIALLTLQLRAAQQEAAQAEAAADAADQAAAREQLKSRLDPMVAERTRALDAALVQAREDAAASVAAAHHEAAQIVAAVTPQAIPTLGMQTPAQPGTGVAVVNGPGFDAEAFATVFASVFARMLDERGFAGGPSPMGVPGSLRMQPKRSFWAHAKHPDVLLLGAAAAIVVVVLVAWMG